jgi:hypothetical protein
MSQMLITETERIARLTRFGYNETEAQFLCLAALHGGYFLRRQFGQFIRREDGGTVSQLTERALALVHVRTSTWRYNTQLYHLCARPFYEALGQGDNRNRRPREWAAIKNKVMGFDFVLAHRHVRYLATEQEKLDYFTGTLGLDPAVLPGKGYRARRRPVVTTRYFLDKYPLFLTEESREGMPPGPTFCFVDEGMISLSRFETYLAQYQVLFAALRAFQLTYVAANERHFAGARMMFARFLMSAVSGAGGHDHREGLLAYFKARRLYETKQFASLDRSQLILFRDGRERFSDTDHEALYARWQTVGDVAIAQKPVPERAVAPRIRGTFSTYLLTYDYGLFGSFLLR